MTTASVTMDQRYPRSARIAHRSDMDRVFTEGRRFHRGPLMLVAIRTGSEATRFGISISRRVGNAAVRNRVKRCLREAFRLHRGELPAGLDAVAVPRTRAVGESVQRAASLLIPLLREADRKLRRKGTGSGTAPGSGAEGNKPGKARKRGGEEDETGSART